MQNEDSEKLQIKIPIKFKLDKKQHGTLFLNQSFKASVGPQNDFCFDPNSRCQKLWFFQIPSLSEEQPGQTQVACPTPKDVGTKACEHIQIIQQHVICTHKYLDKYVSLCIYMFSFIWLHLFFLGGSKIGKNWEDSERRNWIVFDLTFFLNSESHDFKKHCC